MSGKLGDGEFSSLAQSRIDEKVVMVSHVVDILRLFLISTHSTFIFSHRPVNANLSLNFLWCGGMALSALGKLSDISADRIRRFSHLILIVSFRRGEY